MVLCVCEVYHVPLDLQLKEKSLMFHVWACFYCSKAVWNSQLCVSCWGGNDFVAFVSPPPAWQDQSEKTYTVWKSTNSGFSRLQLSSINPHLPSPPLYNLTHSRLLVTTQRWWFEVNPIHQTFLSSHVSVCVCLCVCVACCFGSKLSWLVSVRQGDLECSQQQWFVW